MTKRTKKAWTKWRRLVGEQARSGQTVTAFCRERGLCRPYFFGWKKQLCKRATTKFLEVQVAEPTPRLPDDSRIEIRLWAKPGGRARIRRGTGAGVVDGGGGGEVIGLPSLQAMDRAQGARIWMASEATDMRCGKFFYKMGFT